MRMERVPVTMPRSTAKALRHYAQIHDVDLYMVAKTAVTEYCKVVPPAEELMKIKEIKDEERMFISMPDTAMRLLELWSDNTGISKQKLMEWAIRKLVGNVETVQEDREE